MNKAIAEMCLAQLRAFIQQTNTHKHKQPRLDQGQTNHTQILRNMHLFIILILNWCKSPLT